RVPRRERQAVAQRSASDRPARKTDSDFDARPNPRRLFGAGFSRLPVSGRQRLPFGGSGGWAANRRNSGEKRGREPLRDRLSPFSPIEERSLELACARNQSSNGRNDPPVSRVAVSDGRRPRPRNRSVPVAERPNQV